MERDEMPKRPAPRPDRGPPEHSSTTAITKEAHCYGGYKWRAVSELEASQNGFPHSIKAIQ